MPLTNPPINAVLLKRTTRPALPSEGGTDYVKASEYWYDPATRTAALYQPGISTDPTVYSRPVADVVDRYCFDSGVAPFREMRVHHNGNGGITTDFVDGVATCQLSCTLTVTLTASAVANGRADLTATATGAQGAVLLSLDGFYTAGVAGPTTLFRDVRAGYSYTVTARETRTAGCTATATLTLTAPYGPRYTLHGVDEHSAPYVLSIFEREYTGPVTELDAAAEAVTLDWPGGGATAHVDEHLLSGSECALALRVTTADALRPLFSGDERLHRVEYRRAGVLAWAGYVLPEQYDVAFVDPPYDFALRATDGLGALSGVLFRGPREEPLSGDWALLALVRYLLARTGLALELHTLFNLYPGGATIAAPALEQIRVDVAQFAAEDGTPHDCAAVLTAVLDTFRCRLLQHAGTWRLERLSELRVTAPTYTVYAADGTRAADAAHDLLHTVARAADGLPFWLGGEQRQGLRPAVARVRVATDPGPVANALARLLPATDELPAALPRRWRSRLAPSGVPVSQLLYAGADAVPVVRLFGGTANATTPAQAPYVELPATAPLPLTDLFDTELVLECQGLELSFTATPYGQTPAADTANQSTMYVALTFGTEALGSYGVGLSGTARFAKTTLVPVAFNNAGAVKVVMPFSQASFTQGVQAPRPLTLRLYAPVGGASACMVDITALRLEWKSAPAFSTNVDPADTYTRAYTADTGQLVSRADEGLTLTLLDTPFVRRAGTLLGPGNVPTSGWFEGGVPGPLREAGDYLVRDRVLARSAPAAVLTGTLRRAPGLGPGSLLTDPAEDLPGVYLCTGYTAHEATDTATLTAVRLLALTSPAALLPEGLIYFEDDAPWQDEAPADALLAYENA